MVERRKPRLFREKTQTGEALAMDPQAFGSMFMSGPSALSDMTEEGIAIIKIDGPLEHHFTPWWCSYEEILCRVECAMAGGDDSPPARAVVLCIDSPGGEAAGSMYCHRKLRSLSKQYQVPLLAYADEMAASAAYAIASACEEIWCPDTATIGSIGVIATLFDRTGENEKSGLNVKLVTSGAYKADNHADRPLTDEIEARMQNRVDSLADVFFRCVAKARRVTPKVVAGLEAGVFMGQDAVDVGLADGVQRWDKFLRQVARRLDFVDEATATAAPTTT